jgi:hypothetical protein
MEREHSLLADTIISVGPEGRPGRDGRDGLPGVPGESGVDGAPGQRGRDGLAPDDLDARYDPESRELTIDLSRDGVLVKSKRVKLSGVLHDRDKFDPARAYDAGDVVTRDGSYWVAKAPTLPGTVPGNGATSWRLAVKHGEIGRRGPEGKPGRDGRDVTHMLPNGQKY